MNGSMSNSKLTFKSEKRYFNKRMTFLICLVVVSAAIYTIFSMISKNTLKVTHPSEVQQSVATRAFE